MLNSEHEIFFLPPLGFLGRNVQRGNKRGECSERMEETQGCAPRVIAAVPGTNRRVSVGAFGTAGAGGRSPRFTGVGAARRWSERLRGSVQAQFIAARSSVFGRSFQASPCLRGCRDRGDVISGEMSNKGVNARAPSRARRSSGKGGYTENMLLTS